MNRISLSSRKHSCSKTLRSTPGACWGPTSAECLLTWKPEPCQPRRFSTSAGENMGASPSTQPPSFICMIYCSRTLSFLFKSSCPQASRQKRGCKGEGEQAAPHKVRTCSASGISPASLAGRAWEVAWSPLGLPFSLSMKCSPQFPIYATWLL